LPLSLIVIESYDEGFTEVEPLQCENDGIKVSTWNSECWQIKNNWLTPHSFIISGHFSVAKEENKKDNIWLSCCSH